MFVPIIDSCLQVEASLLFVNLSSNLLDIDVNNDNVNKVHAAASSIVEGASNILDYSSDVSVGLLLHPCGKKSELNNL